MKSNPKGLIWFLAIAFAITWVSIFAIYLIDAPSSGTSAGLLNPMDGLLRILGTFGPAIAAFVTLKWITREGFKDAGLRFNFRAGWSYYLWAVLAPLAVVVMAVLVAGMTGADVSGLSAITLADVISWLVGTLMWTPILFGEEFGWRGYLQPRLAPGRPLLAALLVGLIWGIWHYAHLLSGIVLSANLLGLLIYPVSCAIGSVFYGWLRVKSGSIWPSCLAHAAGNVIVTAAVTRLLPGETEITVWLFRIVGYTLVAIVLVAIRGVPWREAAVEQATTPA